MNVDENLVDRTLLGRYRLDRCIGRGGMASVYEAQIVAGERAGSRAAVKVVHPDLTRDPMVVRRFEREAHAIQQLSHPNVVAIYEHGVDGAQAFIAMELAVGTDLLHALTIQNPLSQARAAMILAQTCRGLEAAHLLGIIHRDLKPENIMLVTQEDGTETVKLLDFGIAKVLEATKSEHLDDPPSHTTQTALTRVGTIVGTPAYMSPEQCRGGNIDGRSDVYACGVLLYQIVTGELPLLGETPLHTAMRHLHAHAREPKSIRSDLHPTLNAIIVRALCKQPSDRQQSARELGDAILALLPELPDVTARELSHRQTLLAATRVAPRPSQPRPPTLKPASPPPRRRDASQPKDDLAPRSPSLEPRQAETETRTLALQAPPPASKPSPLPASPSTSGSAQLPSDLPNGATRPVRYGTHRTETGLTPTTQFSTGHGTIEDQLRTLVQAEAPKLSGASDRWQDGPADGVHPGAISNLHALPHPLSLPSSDRDEANAEGSGHVRGDDLSGIEETVPAFADASRIRLQPAHFAEKSGVRQLEPSLGSPPASTHSAAVSPTEQGSAQAPVLGARAIQHRLDTLPGSTALLIGVAVGLFVAVAVGLAAYLFVR